MKICIVGAGAELASRQLAAVALGPRVPVERLAVREELARQVGATATVNYEDPAVELKTAIREATDGGAETFASFLLLQALNRDHGITLIVVTHDPDLAARCRRRIYLKDGHIVPARQAI